MGRYCGQIHVLGTSKAGMKGCDTAEVKGGKKELLQSSMGLQRLILEF